LTLKCPYVVSIYHKLICDLYLENNSSFQVQLNFGDGEIQTVEFNNSGKIQIQKVYYQLGVYTINVSMPGDLMNLNPLIKGILVL
jgi:hypothetical protein